MSFKTYCQDQGKKKKKMKLVSRRFDQVKPIGSAIWPIQSVDFGQLLLGFWEVFHMDYLILAACLILHTYSLLMTDVHILHVYIKF